MNVFTVKMCKILDFMVFDQVWQISAVRSCVIDSCFDLRKATCKRTFTPGISDLTCVEFGCGVGIYNNNKIKNINMINPAIK